MSTTATVLRRFGAVLPLTLAVALVVAGCTTQPTATYRPPAIETCDPACAREAVESIVDHAGPEAAIAWLDRSADLQIRSDCHALHHRIGRRAGARAWPQYRDDRCEYGYIHGVLQARASAARAVGTFYSEVQRWCGDASIEMQHECAHGAGHATALLIHDDIDAALGACVGVGGWWANLCAGGVLMEYGEEYQIRSGWLRRVSGNSASNDRAGETEIDADDIAGLCTRVAASIAVECYSRIATFIAPTFDGAPSAATAVCDEARSVRAVEACHIGFAEYVIETVARGEHAPPWPPENPAEATAYAAAMVDACAAYRRGDLCIRGVARGIGHLYASGMPFDVPPLCTLAPAPWRPQCEIGMDEARILGGVSAAA